MTAQDIHHRLAEGGGQIGRVEGFALLCSVVQEVECRGFQSGKAEIERVAVDTGVRERKGVRIAALSGFVEMDAAGVGHSHCAGGLIKAFAGRVVAGAGEHAEAGVVLDKDNVAVPSGNHQT